MHKETLDVQNFVWVVLYVMANDRPEDNMVDGPKVFPAFPDVHGYYDTMQEADAYVHSVTRPGELPRYWVRKAYKRVVVK